MPGKANKSSVSKQEENDQPSGSFIFANGEKYDGQYISSDSGTIERDGVGTHTLPNGTSYHGYWKNDKMIGQGHMDHPSGASYEGQFVDNKYHGNGVYTWPDGSKYCGQFENNKIVGKGEYSDSDGHVWGGEFIGRLASGMRLKL